MLFKKYLYFRELWKEGEKMKILLVRKKTVVVILSTLILGGLCYQVTFNRSIKSTINLETFTEKKETIILGYNDLGMHCIQPDYSKFLILPPGNNIRVQVFKRGSDVELLTSGIKVKYKINNQKNPSKYSNFWDYAQKYGYNVSEGVGITGNTLEGFMELDVTKRYWEATAIPVIGIPGGEGATSPYQTATVTIFDETTNEILTEFKNLVVPVSSEMNCDNCHGKQDTWSNILKAHDEEEGTSLFKDTQKDILHRCNECHEDPIFEAQGKKGLPSLSLAMHEFHADKVTTGNAPACYNCHPGTQTDCNRGVMKANGKQCEDCHGDMTKVAESIKAGRIPWIQEPSCEMCHEAKYSVNTNTLYRNSYLKNGPAKDMNNIILCANCHNSPHAEWPSTLDIDNILPITYQGKADPIKDCNICHTKMKGKIHSSL